MSNLKALIVSLAISVGVGALSGFVTGNSMELYKELILPEVAPPGFIFPIVWTILYILMGISAYLVFVSDSPNRKRALQFYVLQLVLNFIWPILFFNFGLYMPAFFVLIALLLAIILMIVNFYKVNPTAAYLQIPYLLWVLFAGYLNLMIAILN